MITGNVFYHSGQGTPEIFCLADDFCKHFSSELKKHQLPDGKVHRNKPSRLSDAEVITILILFHSKGFRCLKPQYVCKHLTHLFPNTVSYNRFIGLQIKVALPPAFYIKEVLLGRCTGIAYVDSTPLRAFRSPLYDIDEVACEARVSD